MSREWEAELPLNRRDLHVLSWAHRILSLRYQMTHGLECTPDDLGVVIQKILRIVAKQESNGEHSK